MIPAFLLCRTGADEWIMMLGESRGWRELIVNEDTEEDDDVETTATGVSA